MSAVSARPRRTRSTRRMRLIAAFASLSVVLTVAPLTQADAGEPGELQSEEVVLAGSGAERLTPASAPAQVPLVHDVEEPVTESTVAADQLPDATGQVPTADDSTSRTDDIETRTEEASAGGTDDTNAPGDDAEARDGSPEPTGPETTLPESQTPTDADARVTTGPAPEGWSASVPLAEGSEMVALTWDASAGAGTDGAVLLRSGDGDAWSEWQDLHATSAEAPDAGGNGTTGVGPVWLGAEGASKVEIVVESGPLANLRLLRMRWIEPTGSEAAGAEPAGPGIRPRSSWAPGGWAYQNDTCSSGPKVMNQLRFAVVHHTVNSNNYSRAQVPGLLAGIYRYHVGSRGWCDVAYQFLIDRFGTVWQGRAGNIAQPIQGGHARGFNLYSVGVALLGEYGSAGVTGNQQAALTSLLAWKLSIHGVDPRGTTTEISGGGTKFPAGQRVTLPTIIGHRDVGQTSCPGSNAYNFLPNLRSRVASTMAATATPARWGPFPDPRAIAVRNYADMLRRFATDTEAAVWASKMQRSGVSPQLMISNITGSGEFDLLVAPVLRLYAAYFNRMPDPDGLIYWIGQHRGARPLLNISENFARSGEFKATYGSLSNRQFVRRVYANVLGRQADTRGENFWTNELSSGRRSRGRVMLGFSNSAEYIARTRLESRIIMQWEAMLGRPPSREHVNNWVAWVRAGGRLSDHVALIFNSAEYAARV